MEAVRNHYLLVYNTTRSRLISLGALQPEDDRLSHLSPNDLSRKSTVAKRQAGDTYRADGKFWSLKPWNWSNTISNQPTSMAADLSSNQEPMWVERGPSEEEASSAASLGGGGSVDVSSGRAWKPNLGLSEVDMEKWERKEDQVQWHRAFADMVRWLEEFELKHVEFVRCIASFDATASAWSAVAAKETREGYAAFARGRADIYLRLRDQAETLFQKNAEPALYNSRENLIQALQNLRKRELEWLWSLAGLENAVDIEVDSETETETGKRPGKRRRKRRDSKSGDGSMTDGGGSKDAQ